MFKIGDKVRVIKSYFAASKGDEGVIKALPKNNGSCKNGRFERCYSVEFPTWTDGHDCGGTVPRWKGQWVDPEYLELIKSASSEKIVITHDGKTTLARLYDNNKVVKSAEAKCDPRDEFNFAAGAKLAFERLTGEEKEEPPKFDKSMLTNGRFGYMEEFGWFVVVGDHLVYERGGYDWLKGLTADGKYRSGYGVKYIVEGVSFRMAKSECAEVIWCAPDFDPKKVTK